MQKQLGLALMLIGVVMFVYGTTISLGYVLVTIDDTPPILVNPYPANGETYPYVNLLITGVEDLESGVQSVTVTLLGTIHNLELAPGSSIYEGVWLKNIPSMTTPGSYSVIFEATNNVGLTAEYLGVFDIYGELQGKWYINNIEITSPSQELKLSTRTLEFKFEVTTGTVQTCTVEWSGPETGSMTLEETLSHTNWIGTHTFTQSGTYTMTLTASDGTSTIQMEIWDVNLGGEAGWEGIQLNMWQWTGLALMGVGSIFTLKGKSKQEA